MTESNTQTITVTDREAFRQEAVNTLSYGKTTDAKVAPELVKSHSITLELADQIVAEAADLRAKASARLQQAKDANGKALPRGKVIARSYADIPPKRTDWLWDQRLPRAAFSVVLGTEGLGKTAWALDIVSKATHGKLDGCFAGEPVTCALFTPEDDQAAVISPRLIAAEADLGLVRDFKLRRDKHDGGFSLPGDTAVLVEALIEANVKIAFCDPIASMLDPAVDTWKDTQVRSALEDYLSLCATNDITNLGSLHTNKAMSNDPRQRAMGTAGWRILARSWLVLGLDPDDEAGKSGNQRCVAHDKSNYGREQPTLRMELVDTIVPVEGEDQHIVHAVMGEACQITAREMLAHEAEDPKAAERKLDKARKWLGAQLAGAPKATAVLKPLAELAGHAWRTVERAKDELNAETTAAGPGAIWSLSGLGV
jgi:AAA domain